jgi:hypothetical protein
MDDVSYTPVVDAMLEWGKTNLLFPGQDEYLSDIRESIFSVPAVDAEKELTPFLRDFIGSVTKGKDVLSNPDLITATPDDVIWTKAENALFCFDQLVFLREAFKHLSPVYNKKLVNRCLPEIEQTLNDIYSWLYESEVFSPLRLTVLNEVRKANLDGIPNEKRYIFPWYGLFVEKGTPLDWMIDNFDLLQEPVLDRNIPPEIKENIYGYIAELIYDKELARVLQTEFHFSKSIEKAVTNNLSMKLFALCQVAITKHLIPSSVEKAGLIPTAVQFIRKMPRKTVSDRIALVLQVAFCGPSLSDTQRLDAFEFTERSLVNISLDDYCETLILGSLKRWSNDEMDDIIFENILFESWFKGLENETETLESLEVEKDEIWGSIEYVLSPEGNTAQRPVKQTKELERSKPSEYWSINSLISKTKEALTTTLELFLLQPIPVTARGLSEDERTAKIVQEGDVLQSGDEIKISFKSNTDAHICIVALGSDNKSNQLFLGHVKAGEKREFPEKTADGKEQYIKLVGGASEEEILLIASEDPFEDLQAVLAIIEKSGPQHLKDMFPGVTVRSIRFRHE